MPLARIPEALEDLKQGRMIILVDDENRENEGDLTMAAEKVSPEAINFMAKNGRGLICLSLHPENGCSGDWRRIPTSWSCGTARVNSSCLLLPLRTLMVLTLV